MTILAPRGAMGQWMPWRLQSPLVRAWYDETTTLSSSGWQDRSPNGNHLLTIEGSPTIGEPRKGRRVTLLDECYLQYSFSNDQPCEVWAACRFCGVYSSFATLVDGDTSALVSLYRSGDYELQAYAGADGTTLVANTDGAVSLTDRWVVLRLALTDGGASILYENGLNIGQAVLGTNDPSGLTLGGGWDGSNLAHVEVGELGVTEPLNDGMAAKLTGALQWKWV